MHGFELLRDLLVLLACGVAVVVAFRHLRLPPIIGFLATGVLCGPSALGLIGNTREIELLAEIGVILLLFTVGLEFSLEKLVQLRWLLALGGGLQVLLTAGATAVVLRWLGWSWARAEFFGMLVALSSTAIAIRLISERGEVDTLYGRSALAILIFQDLCVVPMVLLTPFLAGGGGSGGFAVAVVAAKAAGFLALAGLVSRFAIPTVFRLAVATRRREVFLLTVVVLCLGAAWLSAWAGLSLALGAFIAGLLLSQSEFAIQALGDVLPFRELFNSLFFISVGLLVDVRTAVAHPGALLGAAAGVLVLKSLAGGVAPLLAGQPLRAAAATGLTLAQVGEFSFVLAAVGRQAGLVEPVTQQGFLVTAVATMALTPWLQSLGARVYRREGGVWSWRVPWFGGAAGLSEDVRERLRDHVIVVGYGVNGRNLGRVLRAVEIPYVVVEVNPSTVSTERTRGTPIFYGDATTPETLGRARVAEARVLVVAISDAPSTRRIVALARRLNPALRIIARTRYVAEVQPIQALGAQDVIPEEFETSVELFTRVLRNYLVPRDVVEGWIREVRRDAYGMLREADAEARTGSEARRFLEGLAFETFRIAPGSSLAGRTILESRLRTSTGATIVALLRSGAPLVPNPGVTERLEAGAIAVVLGSPRQLAEAAKLLGPREPGADGEEVEP